MIELYLPDYYKSFNLTAIDPATITKYNALGKPIFMPVYLNNIHLPVSPMISVQLSKNIELTRLAGSTERGSIKQAISIEDYKITIRGWLKSDDMNVPEDDFRQLRELWEQNASIPIDCLLTDIFDITRVVIISMVLPEQRAQNVVFYEIECISDDDFILEYND